MEGNLAHVARMIGDPARAEMLGALLGGEALTSGELARRAGVAPATASEHLARLVDGGLVVRRSSGRHRYYALAGPDVAVALEGLARISPDGGTAARRDSPEMQALRFARTCYDHLAGGLGVRLADTLLERGFIAPDGFAVTDTGRDWLRTLDIDLDELRKGRRALTRQCLDWTERRDHLAGAVGAALASAMLERRWLVRIDGSRALRLTLRGREGLYRSLALEIDTPS